MNSKLFVNLLISAKMFVVMFEVRKFFVFVDFLARGIVGARYWSGKRKGVYASKVTLALKNLYCDNVIGYFGYNDMIYLPKP